MYSWRRSHLDWIRLWWWWWWLPILVLGLIIEKTVTILIIFIIIIVMMEALSQPCFTIAFYSWFLVGGLLFFVHVYAVQGLESFFFLYWNLDVVDDWHLTSVIIDFFLFFFLFFKGGNCFMLPFSYFFMCREAWFLGFLPVSLFFLWFLLDLHLRPLFPSDSASGFCA